MPIWTRVKSELPSSLEAASGCVAEVNDTILIGRQNTVHKLKRTKKWQKSKNVRIPIHQLIESDGRCFIEGCEESTWKIFEYFEKKSSLKEVTALPVNIPGVSIKANQGILYAVGGNEGTTGSTQAHCFDLRNSGDGWIPIQSLSHGRFNCSMSFIDDRLFIGGGWNAKNKPCNSVECLSLGAERWTQKCPTTEKACEITNLYGRPVATGGINSLGLAASQVVNVYADENNSWLPLPSMSKPRYHHGACTTGDGRLFVVGGWGSYGSIEGLDCEPSLRPLQTTETVLNF